MPDQSLEARRIAREQQRRVASTTAVGLNTIRPILQFQISALRMWANNIEMLMRNCERGLETFNAAVEHDSNQQRAA
jgi:hypothetical protein